ncbi:MAG: DUF1016 family protein [Planctomycetes bacterium]|nr:DUF1016 family protein [Planctomycetota bacterium]
MTRNQECSTAVPQGYEAFLREVKERMSEAQVRAARAVGSELVRLYWRLGKEILKRQESQGWGSQVIERLALDLRAAFPGTQGLSSRNLRSMRDLAREFPDSPIWQQLLPNCPWGHVLVVMNQVKDPEARRWYLERLIQRGWSRNVLSLQIESRLFEREGHAITNFESVLSKQQSDLTREILRDPYAFEFLGLGDAADERAVETALVERMRRFLLELGQGFAFVGSQVHLDVGGESFYLDLLFYHLKLRCYVVVELKSGAFKPEHAGKLNFYLAVVDDRMRHASDQPSIGLILCRERNRVVAEYALRVATNPIGVSQYALTRSLPKELSCSLPPTEALEAQLAGGSCDAD